MQILTPISPGELFDKITILEIKLAEMTDPQKLANVRREFDLLMGVVESGVTDRIQFLELTLTEVSVTEEEIALRTQLEMLMSIRELGIKNSPVLSKLYRQLYEANKKIWDTENDVREFWNDDLKFLKAARGSHFHNDERARIKREINTLLGSSIIEEKSHPKYEHKT